MTDVKIIDGTESGDIEGQIRMYLATGWVLLQLLIGPKSGIFYAVLTKKD